MPRYFFHLRNQGQLHEDNEGIDLADLHAALEEALRADRELTAEPAGIYNLEFEITDGAGRMLLKVPVQGQAKAPLIPRTVMKPDVKRLAQAEGDPRLLH